MTVDVAQAKLGRINQCANSGLVDCSRRRLTAVEDDSRRRWLTSRDRDELDDLLTGWCWKKVLSGSGSQQRYLQWQIVTGIVARRGCSLVAAACKLFEFVRRLVESAEASGTQQKETLQ